MKTNELTGRVKEGEAGFTVEFGRPGVGVYFKDMDKMCRALAKMQVEFQPENPVTALMADVKAGKLQTDVLNEKVLSCILEFKADIAKIPDVLKKIEDEVRQLDKWYPFWGQVTRAITFHAPENFFWQ